MKFHVTAKMMILINGNIKSIEAGEIETTDKDLIAALEGANGVDKAQPKSKSKQSD